MPPLKLSTLAIALPLLAWAQPPRLETGSRIRLTVVKEVSSKTARAGDPVYFETAAPILGVERQVLVPAGSRVSAVITSAKSSGRGQLHIRMESLILPDGTVKELAASITRLEAGNPAELGQNGTIRARAHRTTNFKAFGGLALCGALAGTIIGERTLGPRNILIKERPVGPVVKGMAIGGAAGAVAGLAFLRTRTPAATLPAGSAVDIRLDRPLDLNPAPERSSSPHPAPAPVKLD